MTKKKLLSPLILLVLSLSLLSALSVNMTTVSAGVYPALYVDPPSITDVGMTPGSTFTVSIKTDYIGDDITAYQLMLSYNPFVLHGVSVTNGDLITTEVTPYAIFIPGTFDNTAGKLSGVSAFFADVNPTTVVPGPGTLANVTFEVVGYGDSPITIAGSPIVSTVLFGFTEGGEGHKYEIINAYIHPTHVQHGYFCNTDPQPTHDIAVIGVTPNDTEVIQSELVDVTVDVENQGTAVERFDVSLYFDIYSLIGKVTNVILGGGDNVSLTFTWDTTIVAVATHTLRAVASTVWGETDTGDNQLIPPDTVTVLPQIGAILIAPDEGNPGKPVTFDASLSYSLKGTIVSYEWNFGDESTANMSTPIIEHTYKWLGVYSVNLWVTDDTGARSDAAYHTMQILEPAAYLADLVKWKAKPEKSHWIESKDDDGNVTLTALAKNTGTRAIETTITFAILDMKGEPPIWAESVDLRITVPGDEKTTSVVLDPHDCGWDGTSKLVLYAHVTLTYDSDNDGIPDTDASTKVTKFSVMP